MPEKWTGNLVGKMHVHRVSYEELAQRLGGVISVDDTVLLLTSDQQLFYVLCKVVSA